jgi:hypothetical protein
MDECALILFYDTIAVRIIGKYNSWEEARKAAELYMAEENENGHAQWIQIFYALWFNKSDIKGPRRLGIRRIKQFL